MEYLLNSVSSPTVHTFLIPLTIVSLCRHELCLSLLDPRLVGEKLECLDDGLRVLLLLSRTDARVHEQLGPRLRHTLRERGGEEDSECCVGQGGVGWGGGGEGGGGGRQRIGWCAVRRGQCVCVLSCPLHCVHSTTSHHTPHPRTSATDSHQQEASNLPTQPAAKYNQ